MDLLLAIILIVLAFLGGKASILRDLLMLSSYKNRQTQSCVCLSSETVIGDTVSLLSIINRESKLVRKVTLWYNIEDSKRNRRKRMDLLFHKVTFLTSLDSLLILVIFPPCVLKKASILRDLLMLSSYKNRQTKNFLMDSAERNRSDLH